MWLLINNKLYKINYFLFSGSRRLIQYSPPTPKYTNADVWDMRFPQNSSLESSINTCAICLHTSLSVQKFSTLFRRQTPNQPSLHIVCGVGGWKRKDVPFLGNILMYFFKTRISYFKHLHVYFISISFIAIYYYFFMWICINNDQLQWHHLLCIFT